MAPKQAPKSKEVVQAPRAQTNSIQKKSFFDADTFEGAIKIADFLSTCSFIPKAYQGEKNKSNIVVALEMASRVGASPMAVMQNMHVIQGRPSWSSPFIIATINSCGRFSPIKFKLIQPDKMEKIQYTVTWRDKNTNEPKSKSYEVEVHNSSCFAYATDIDSGDVLEGTRIDIRMAFAEGWYQKTGSKWPTMTGHMLRYRAAAFFGRLYCPEMLMGMQAADEVRDITYSDDAIEVQTVVEDVVEIKSEAQETVDELNEELFEESLNQETPEQREEAETDGSDANTTNA